MSVMLFNCKGDAIHKAAVAAIEMRPGSADTDPRVMVHLRAGGSVQTFHDSQAEARRERDRLVSEWTQPPAASAAATPATRRRTSAPAATA
jgi:hypothetical protein